MSPASHYIRANSTPLEPIATELSPRLPELEGIRAVAFDIYGTLVISGSGDIGVSDADQKAGTLRTLLVELGAEQIPGNPATLFHDLIVRSHENSRAKGIDYPEVDIVEIWTSLLQSCDAPIPSEETLQQAATAYEVATNPVWPMPGGKETVSNLQKSGFKLGIVSNAQFYTPSLFEAFWEKSLHELGFDPLLCFYSYRYSCAKPGLRLYEMLVDALADQSMSPDQTLYVGNDMLKDVHPAAELGFRTALFAGDQRSLRLRHDHQGLRPPDVILTSLSQILNVIGESPA